MALRGRLAATLGKLVPLALIVCQPAVLLLFLERWNSVSALTVVPLWCYCVLGIAMAAISAALFRNGLSYAAILIWFATLLTCPDEAPGLARFWKQAPLPGAPAPTGKSKTPLRVVTLNCHHHFTGDLETIKTWQPDIVLLQETPFRSQLTKFAADLYGKHGAQLAVPAWDCSIVARGKITLRKTPPYFTQAKVDLPDGRTVEVVSLHLHGAETRLSLHRRETWKLHASSRRIRMGQMSSILQSLLKHARHRPWIIGGDFNSPAGDRVYFSLYPKHTDSFSAAGVGWGNTVMNHYPMHRIDQIWASTDALRPARSKAVITEYSDHRMVVSDFDWK